MSSPEDLASSPRQLEALLSLLDDENPRVQAACAAALERLGDRALESLRDAARRAPTPARRAAARRLAAPLAFEAGLARVLAARERGEALLEAGVGALATLPDPCFDPVQLADALDLHAAMLRARLGPGTPLPRCIEILARYVHGELGLRGNEEAYYDPRNSFVNEVLERKLGIPISIAAIYLLLARRLDLPLRGYGIPAHFLLGYVWDGRRRFIDAFHRGQVLEPGQVREAAQSQGFAVDPETIEPATDTDILVRMTNNLRRILESADPEGWLPAVERLRRALLGAESA
jgi:regulator of sirC expression with transglutaminase-like and TPR domain